MKNLILIGMIVMSFTAISADITCARYGGGSYAISKDAKQLASHLGKNIVKCDGKKFQGAVKMLKQKIKYVDATPEQIAQIEGAKTVKREKQLGKKLKGFSFN